MSKEGNKLNVFQSSILIALPVTIVTALICYISVIFILGKGH